MPKIAEVKLSSCGLEVADLGKNCKCGIAVAEQHFLKSCGIAIAEVLPSSCGIAIAEVLLSSCGIAIVDSKKICAAHLWYRVVLNDLRPEVNLPEWGILR
jgi:hypothetical protein